MGNSLIDHKFPQNLDDWEPELLVKYHHCVKMNSIWAPRVFAYFADRSYVGLYGDERMMTNGCMQDIDFDIIDKYQYYLKPEPEDTAFFTKLRAER